MLDKTFLEQLDRDNNRITYIRLTALDNNDMPREQIEGRATGGSISIDGASAINRTCNLTLLALEEENVSWTQEDINARVPITDPYWAFNNKFKLEIGLQNDINDYYPPIIWFKQGVFIIKSFSKSYSTNSLTISIGGQDKMCRLNGTVSGALPHDSSFDVIEEEIMDSTDNSKGTGEYAIKKLLIHDIIRNSVMFFGQERLENIIINDLDDSAWDLWEYRGDTDAYLIYAEGRIINMILDGDVQVVTSDEQTYRLSEIPQYYSMNSLDPNYNKNATVIVYSALYPTANVIKIKYGDTVGYKKRDLTYNTDLILKAGEPLTNMLDKLCQMLGNYEYFYDLDGRFVFQKKKTYMQELFSPVDGKVTTPTMISTPYAYEFNDKKLFTAMNYSPQINRIFNDYAVWGTRKGVKNNNLSFHVRYAIDTKPIDFTSYDGIKYTTENYDWRELIYQMALDYYKNNLNSDYLLKIANNNPWAIGGKTGYEQYYTDMQGFWRLLYNPNPKEFEKTKYYGEEDGEYKYWNKNIHQDPSQLEFWFDFLDWGTDTGLGRYSVRNIGVRTKVDKQQSSITSIYNNKTPEAQFIIMPEEIDEWNNGEELQYSPIWIQTDMVELFGRSAQGKSAIERVNELIDECTSYGESLAITSIPIYHLLPNTRIYIKDEGDFIIDKISYSLSHNSTMSLSCKKVYPQIF